MTSELIQQFLDSKVTLAASSLKSYNSTLNRFETYCLERNTDIIHATEKDIGEFIKPYVYKKTQDTYKRALSSFYKWAIKKQITTQNFTDELKTRGTKKQHKLMTYECFKVILNKCGGLRETTIVSFMWYTGVRTKELINIRMKDIDLVNNIIYVGFSKSTSGIREIPIHLDLRFLLNKYMKKAKEVRIETNNKSQILFLNKQGSPIKKRTLQHLITMLQINIPKEDRFTVHDFRRAFVTNVYNESRDIVLAQELAGHASVETTRKYIITNGKDRHKKFMALKLQG